MKPAIATLAALLLAALVSGCAADPPPRAAQAEEQVVEINRTHAIRAARSDAAARYGEGWIAWVDATQIGRYWLVELRTVDGKGMRYAISTNDGSIRQRSVFQ